MHAFLRLNLSATAHDVLCHNVRWICLVPHSICSHTPALSLTPSFVNKKNNGLAGYYTYPPSECMFYDTPARCPRDPVRFVKAYYGKSALGGAVGHDTFYDKSGGDWVPGATIGEDDVFEPPTTKGGRCEGWCTGEQVPWVVRCGWDSNACSGCAQCP